MRQYFLFFLFWEKTYWANKRENCIPITSRKLQFTLVEDGLPNEDMSHSLVINYLYIVGSVCYIILVHIVLCLQLKRLLWCCSLLFLSLYLCEVLA